MQDWVIASLLAIIDVIISNSCKISQKNAVCILTEIEQGSGETWPHCPLTGNRAYCQPEKGKLLTSKLFYRLIEKPSAECATELVIAA